MAAVNKDDELKLEQQMLLKTKEFETLLAE